MHLVYAVIDTNVFISALITKNSEASTVKVLEAVLKGDIVPLYHEDIIAEYDEVLHRAKFKLPDEIIVRLLNDIVSNGFEVKNVIEVKEEMPDTKDIVFYAVTLSASDKESVLVTGNGKHFPSKPLILTPLELVQILEEK